MTAVTCMRCGRNLPDDAPGAPCPCVHARREPLSELGRFAIIGNALGDITDPSIADEAGRHVRSEVQA